MARTRQASMTPVSRQSAVLKQTRSSGVHSAILFSLPPAQPPDKFRILDPRGELLIQRVDAQPPPVERHRHGPWRQG